MATTTTTPTTLENKDVVAIKTYTQKGTGIRFATASNWKQMLMQPKADAIATTMVTAQGYTFVVYAETEVEAYDAEAEAKRKQATAEVKAQMKDLDKEFFTLKSISVEEYNKRHANLVTALATL